MYVVTNVARYDVRAPRIPIQLCINSGKQLTRVSFQMSCGHFTDPDATTKFTKMVWCNKCSKYTVFKPVCPQCHMVSFFYFLQTFRVHRDQCQGCLNASSHNLCQALVKTHQCQKYAAYNNGGFCRIHFNWDRVRRWLLKGLQGETPLCSDLISLLVPYLQLSAY